MQVKAFWCKETQSLIVKKEPLKDNIKNRSVDFLDCTVWFDADNKIQTDLFVKDSSKVTYLLPSSCHPGHITKNIPYSLAYRLKRICSRDSDLQKRLSELKSNLINRNYSKKVIDNAFQRVTLITREKALEKVFRPKKINPILAVTYDSRIVGIPQIVQKHLKRSV